MAAARRVVVTGLGTVNPLGLDVPSFWEACLAGRSGVGEIRSFDASPLRTRIAAEVTGFDPEAFMDRRIARRMDRYGQFFLVAAGQALADAGLAYGRATRRRSAPGWRWAPASAASSPSRRGWTPCGSGVTTG